MTKDRKIFLTFSAFVPLLYFAGIFLFIMINPAFYFFNNIYTLLAWAVIVIYFRIAVKSDHDLTEKIIWGITIIVFSAVSIPLYWYYYIRPISIKN